MILSVEMRQKLTLPLVLGLCEGVITVLTLAAKLLIRSNVPVTLGFAVRVSLVSLITGLFVYFISQYSELRRELLHLELEINLTDRGHLATTQLGKKIIHEAVIMAFVGSGCAFLGSFIPLVIAILIQDYKWASLVFAVILLGVLGIFLAKLVHGSKIRWAAALIVSGLLVAYIGLQLDIVS